MPRREPSHLGVVLRIYLGVLALSVNTSLLRIINSVGISISDGISPCIMINNRLRDRVPRTIVVLP